MLKMNGDTALFGIVATLLICLTVLCLAGRLGPLSPGGPVWLERAP